MCAAKDGTVIGLIQERMGILPLINPRGIKYDAMKLNWIGAMSAQQSVCFVWHTSTARTIDDAMTREVLVGGTNAGGSSSVFPRVLNETVGTRFKLVQGYPGTQDLELAMEREESRRTLRLRLGRDQGDQAGLGAGQKDPRADADGHDQGARAAGRAADPRPRSPIRRRRPRWNSFWRARVMGRPFVAPPGVPAERVKVLRDAFDATVRDPDFLAKAKVQSLEIDPMSGADDPAAAEQALFDAGSRSMEPAREWLK